MKKVIEVKEPKKNIALKLVFYFDRHKTPNLYIRWNKQKIDFDSMSMTAIVCSLAKDKKIDNSVRDIILKFSKRYIELVQSQKNNC